KMRLLLQDLFEPSFTDACYSYRPGRSAAMAVERVEQYIKEGNDWLFETDIKDFFDNLSHSLIIEFLRERILDDRIINLILRCLQGEIADGMKVETNAIGSFQGSALSPVLSNIYLCPLDSALVKAGYAYARYSDDLIILAKRREDVERAAALCENLLVQLGLKLKKEKTFIKNIEESFDFLGYSFSRKGRSVSVKAIGALREKMKSITSRAGECSNPEYIFEELEDAIIGWQNYYGKDIPVQPIDEYSLVCLAKLAAEGKCKLDPDELDNLRRSFHFKDELLLIILAGSWERMNYPEKAVLECAAALRLNPDSRVAVEMLKRLLPLKDDSFRKATGLLIDAIDRPDIDTAGPGAKLIEILCEEGLFSLAQNIQAGLIARWTQGCAGETALKEDLGEQSQEAGLEFTEEDIELMLELFSGREGMHAVEMIDADGRRRYRPVPLPLEDEQLKRHLRGEETAGMYLVRVNQTVKLAVIDIDIGRRQLFECQQDNLMKEALLELAHRDAVRIIECAAGLGIKGYIEDSGYRGRHCWFFFEEPVKAATAREMVRLLMNKAGSPSEGITWEVFPESGHLRAGQPGSLIKIPFGVHKLSGKRSLFLQENGPPYPDQASFLRQVVRIPLQSIAALVDLEGGDRLPRERLPVHSGQEILAEQAVGAIKDVLQKCTVIRHLVSKAESTNYLTHRERIILLQTFGLMGEDGKAFLHRIMSRCINYNRKVTERYIGRVLPKPISCPRIREDLQAISSSLKCDCYFRLAPGTYPSPVLHGQKIKMRRKQTKEEGAGYPKTGPGVLQFLPEIELLVEKMTNLRRHRQGVENSILKCESRLTQIFDQLNTDHVETRLGVLTRKKSNGKYDWVIQI
ncbi:MAG: hypothetical protein K6T65_15840, partial [Peptococcaceae bacterium]|nr:hypothetical protein [Peptococcaceae bacterium]